MGRHTFEDRDYSTCGVYAIRHKQSGKLYIGSTALYFAKRWREHLSVLRRGKHYSKYLQRAWSKYGEEAFEFVVLEQTPASDASAREEFYIGLHNATDARFGYNSSEYVGKPFLGRTHSPEAKARISAAKRGKPGRKRSREEIERGAAKRRGQKASPEQRKRMSLAHVGKKQSPELIARRVAARIGRPLPEAHLNNLRIAKRKSGKLTQDIVDQIRRRYKPGDPVDGSNALAREFGIDPSYVCRILDGRVWKPLPGDGRSLTGTLTPKPLQQRTLFPDE